MSGKLDGREGRRIKITHLPLAWKPPPNTKLQYVRYLKSLPPDHSVMVIFRFLQSWWLQYKRAPTYVEIMRGGNGRSYTSRTLNIALKRLVCGGWVERLPLPDHHGGRGDGHIYKPRLTPYAKKHEQVYAFCRRHYAETGIPATKQQIMDGVKVSEEHVQRITEKLIEDGYLERTPLGVNILYKPPDMGVVELAEYYRLLEWAGQAKMKGEGK